MADGTVVAEIVTLSAVCFGGSRNSTGTLPTDKLFTGQRLDSTGLYYYGARYYDPAMGRFISADPLDGDLTNPQSQNKYSYVLNNPLRYVDPTGMFAVKTFLKGLSQLGKSVASTFTASLQAGGAILSGFFSGTILMTAAGNNIVDAGSNYMSGMENIARACDDKSPIDYSYNPVHNSINKYVDNETLNTSLHIGYGIIDMLTSVKGLVGLEAPRSSSQKGGLNLYKSNKPQTSSLSGWKEGDRMINFPDQGSPKANWEQNYGILRAEMRNGNPIFDSYRGVNGEQIPSGGFLGAERYTLENRGWIYDSTTGAYSTQLPK